MIQLVFKIVKFLLIVSLLLIHQLGFGQFTIPPKPDFQTSVYDYAVSYQITKDTINILRVRHNAQKPKKHSWKV